MGPPQTVKSMEMDVLFVHILENKPKHTTVVRILRISHTMISRPMTTMYKFKLDYSLPSWV